MLTVTPTSPLFRVRWGLERVAVVDIDVHFGNGTAELLRGDPRAFFASVHMIYGDENSGSSDERKGGPRSIEEESNGFYPSLLGTTEVTDTYVSVGVFPPLPSSKGERNYFGRNPSAASKEQKEIKLERMNSEDSQAMVTEPLVNSSSSSSSSSSSGSGRSNSSGLLKDTKHNNCSDHDINAAQTVTPSNKASNSNHEKEGGREHARTDTKSPSTPGPKSRPLGEFRGVTGFRRALSDVIIPQVQHLLCLEQFEY